MWSESNPFLNGPFEPLTQEYAEGAPVVVGRIPPELSGALYRTGNSLYYKPLNADRAHWFDGDGMTHAFFLEGGTARYACKWVKTEGLLTEQQVGRALYNGLYGVSNVTQGELPPGAPAIKVVAGINVIPLAGRVLALHELESHYWELDPETLETIGTFDFNGRFGNKLLTAHPHVDPSTGETLFVAQDYKAQTVTCFAVDGTGNVTSEHTVHMDSLAWIHDFIFSKDWFIFFLSPLLNNIAEEGVVAQGKGVLSLDKSVGTRIFLVNRHDGSTVMIRQESDFQITHFLNAYQEGDKIVVDACIADLLAVPDAPPIGEVFPFAFPHVSTPVFGSARMVRTLIDVHNSRSTQSSFEGVVGEFLRTNEAISGTKHRFGYLALVDPEKGGQGFNSLAKFDFETRAVQVQGVEQRYSMIPGEPIFVPHPSAESEDHGWILAVWWDPARNASELVILDARAFDQEPVARVKINNRIPLAFHGNWISRSQLKSR
ncbi:carotenoid oxygenase family protein [Paraburkholderia sp. BL25I1N1]|uniref:carotenoid oxygenase family protein n=1 Tax=Paraburkholderia sp. BL25I1N1 TaxID=1938804 RepID=UPI000D06DDBD|nr:carotenoid oxygenase family protein [Paraburkholderia sp. BL25I1N1]PRX96393.1 all-trans-8'-apo-beta-carotenal 15,15'-oxygenase/carotenoid cleavage dioxygenase [Paraburkholderia sp. BL25I1N1]